MANYPDSRFFLFPAFSINPLGVIEWRELDTQILPSEVFDCEYREYTGDRKILPPDREATSIFSIVSNGGGSVFFASWRRRMPVFWRIEFFNEITGELLPESTYFSFWPVRKHASLPYASFAQGKRGAVFFARGRLIELFLYLLFYEADEESVTGLTQSVRMKVFRDNVSQLWDRLSVSVDFQSEDSGTSILMQLSARHDVVAELRASLKSSQLFPSNL